MKKILFLIVSAFVLMSCGDEIPQPHKTMRSGRTVLAYLVANNDLDGDIMKNVVDMYEGLSRMEDSSAVILFYKPYIRSNSKNELESLNGYINAPCILKYETDGHGKINNKPALLGADLSKKNIIAQAEILKTLPMDVNSLDPKVMETIFRDMVDEAPTRNFALIFGSHATSWLPAGDASRSFGKDGKTEINIPEMSKALSKVFNRENLDFILWDACMMGTVEVAHQFKDVTNYMIASVMESPASGFPYKEIMKNFYKNQIPFDEICKSTINFYEKSGWGTVAAIDCRYIEELAVFVRKNRNLLDAEILSANMNDIQQYGAMVPFKYDFSGFSFDVFDTFSHLGLAQVSDELTAIMERLVVAKECLEGKNSGYYNVVLEKSRFSGIGMYLPMLNLSKKWNECYKTLSWCKVAGLKGQMN